jgi:hypothetical protein
VAGGKAVDSPASTAITSRWAPNRPVMPTGIYTLRLMNHVGCHQTATIWYVLRSDSTSQIKQPGAYCFMQLSISMWIDWPFLKPPCHDIVAAAQRVCLEMAPWGPLGPHVCGEFIMFIPSSCDSQQIRYGDRYDTHRKS